jgi:hypothetical protein
MLGAKGKAVSDLQTYLVIMNYLDRQYITGYYGSITQLAVSKYVHDSRQIATTSSCITATASTTTRLPKSYRFNSILKLGMTSPDVQSLQIFLNDHGFTVSVSGSGSYGHESTYFGPATYRALAKFQEANASAILVPNGLTKGTGYFGSATMKVVNGMI